MDVTTGTSLDAAAWPPTLAGVDAWLRAPEGRARLRRALGRHRLPGALADDLFQEALYRAWRAIDAGTDIASVPAFTTTLLVRAARDLLRGAARRGELAEHPAGDDDALDRAASDLSPGDDDPVGDAAAGALTDAAADRVRRSVAGLLAPQPSCGAAALAFVVLVADGAWLPADAPAPGAGVDPAEGLAWGALWYAGRDDCVEALAGDAAPAAVRARRSRALRAMRALLAQAAGDLARRDSDSDGDHHQDNEDGSPGHA